MSVQFVGYSAPVFANNANVTLTHPAGTQVGDLLVALVGVTSGFLPVTLSGGWTYLNNATFQGSADNSAAIFWRVYAAHDLDPVFGPGAPSTNGPVGAILMAFRNAHPSFLLGVRTTETSTASIGVTTGAAQVFAEGDEFIYSHSGADDYQLTSATPVNWTPAASSTTQGRTTLGRDLGLSIFRGLVGQSLPPSGTENALSVVNTLAPRGVYFVLRVRKPPDPIIAPTPTGGARVGGGADSFYLSGEAIQPYTAEGGVIAGGAAETRAVQYGLRRRAIGDITSSCSPGPITVALPAGTQTDDLVVIVAFKSSLETFSTRAETPAGWNTLPLASNTRTECFVFWRRWLSTDSFTTVQIPWSNEGTAYSKNAYATSFHNVDWSHNGGNPFAAPTQGSQDSISFSYPFYSPSGTQENSVLHYYVSRNSSPANMTASSISDAWAGDVSTGAGFCSANYSTSVASARRYSPGIRQNAIAPSGYDRLFQHSFNREGHWINVSVATLGENGGGLSFTFEASGGAVLGGAATTLAPGAANEYAAEGAGGARLEITGSPGYFQSQRTPPRFAVSFSWPSAARPAASAGWIVSASAAGAKLELTQVNIRRTLMDGNRVVLYALASSAPCVPGDPITVSVGLRLQDRTIAEGFSWSAVARRVYQTQDLRWTIDAEETGLRTGGASWREEVISRSSYGERVEANIEIVAGDYVNGIRATEVTTSLVARGIWSTEVFNGAS